MKDLTTIGFLAIRENGELISEKRFDTLEEANLAVKKYEEKIMASQIANSLNSKFNHRGR